MPQISNLGICYEAIQRIYRNSVITKVRSTLKTKYADHFEERVKGIFKKEWDEIEGAAQQRRISGEVEHGLVDALDVLGVNHFYNLFEAFYVDIFPEDRSVHPAQAKANKQTLLNWSKTIKNLRDPLSHPAEGDYSFHDAFSMLDPARRILSRIGDHAGSEEIRTWMDELQGLVIKTEIDPAVQKLDSLLPPSESVAVDFVGRTRELSALQAWFDDTSSKRWALAGEGGKGKSAIAYRFSTTIVELAPAPFQMVIWLSAKQRRFDEGETLSIASPDFSDLDTALNYLLSAFGWREHLHSDLNAKREATLKLLAEFPSLIVVDDADTLEGMAEDAAEFFALDLPRTRSKVLLTSRRVLFGMGNKTTHVSGLMGEEAQDFISSRCRLTELDFNLVKPYIDEILKITEGSPLYIEDLLRLSSVMPMRNAITAWKSLSGDAARGYALGRELDLLSRGARDVLIAACIPGKPVSHYEVEAIAGLSSEEVTGALKELQKLFLVSKPSIFEGEERFNVNLNIRLLVKKTEGRSDGFRRAEHAWANITKGVGRTHDEIVSAAIRRANLLVRNRQHTEAETTLTTALRLRPNHPSLFAFLGWVYKSCDPRRTTDSRAAFERAEKLGCTDIQMYIHWAQMELELKEWSKAAISAETGLRCTPDNYELLHMAGHARQRAGRDLLNGRHLEKGWDELKKAEAHLTQAIKSPGGNTPRSDTFRTLALVYEGLNSPKNIAKIFHQWTVAYPDDLLAKSEWVRMAAKFEIDSSMVTGR
jgi:tetratricopeptide (TPR) repeat protein